MITCPKCGKECKDTAKFCGGCRYEFPSAAKISDTAQGNICPQCGNIVRPGANFCGKCRAPISQRTVESQTQKENESLTNTPTFARVGSFVQWNIDHGILAVKIDEQTIIEKYGKAVKGIVIQEGIKALVFVHGKIIATLESGAYPFKGWENEVPPTDKPGIMRRIMGAFCNLLPNGWRERAERAGWTNPEEFPFCFVLVRASEFPLIYTFPDIHTATVSCNVGIHFLLKVTNLNDFYTNLLYDKKFISFDAFRENKEQNNEQTKALIAGIRNQINFAFQNIKPEQVATTPEVQAKLLSQLQSVISGIYPFFQVTRILKVSADNADLENFRQMAEDLYVSERELTVLTQRNDFLMRLQDVKNDQEFAEFNQRTQHDNRMQDARNDLKSVFSDNQHYRF